MTCATCNDSRTIEGYPSDPEGSVRFCPTCHTGEIVLVDPAIILAYDLEDDIKENRSYPGKENERF